MEKKGKRQLLFLQKIALYLTQILQLYTFHENHVKIRHLIDLFLLLHRGLENKKCFIQERSNQFWNVANCVLAIRIRVAKVVTVHNDLLTQ